jgi:hypothetical protein
MAAASLTGKQPGKRTYLRRPVFSFRDNSFQEIPVARVEGRSKYKPGTLYENSRLVVDPR